MRSMFISALFSVVSLSAVACGGKDAGGGGGGGGGASALPAEAVAKANEIYVQRCTPCHGASGHGDGAASATLNPKPRNFSDPEWQKSVDDGHIMKIIKMGGMAVGKSAAMPANPDIKDPDVIAALKDHVRSFSGK